MHVLKCCFIQTFFPKCCTCQSAAILPQNNLLKNRNNLIFQTGQKQPLQVFCKKVLLKFRKFYMKTPMLESLFNRAYNFYYKETPVEVFFCEYCEISKNTYFEQNLRTTASNRNHCLKETTYNFCGNYRLSEFFLGRDNALLLKQFLQDLSRKCSNQRRGRVFFNRLRTDYVALTY